MLESFVEMQNQGLCDGFLWPYECGRLPDFEWSDGVPAARFETRRGALFLHPSAIHHYGYREEADFTRAATRAQLTVKTVRGILTVGPLRCHPPCSRSVYVTSPDLPVKLEFPVCTPVEEQEVAATLRQYLPQARVAIGPRWLGGIQSPTPSFFKSWSSAWGGKMRGKIALLAMLVVAVTLLSVAGLFDRQWHLVAACLSLLFIAFVASITREASCEEKSPTPSPSTSPPTEPR